MSLPQPGMMALAHSHRDLIVWQKAMDIVAYSSGGELETQIEIAKRLPLGKALDFHRADELLNEVMRMLNKMIASLRS